MSFGSAFVFRAAGKFSIHYAGISRRDKLRNKNSAARERYLPERIRLQLSRQFSANAVCQMVNGISIRMLRERDCDGFVPRIGGETGLVRDFVRSRTAQPGGNDEISVPLLEAVNFAL